MQDTHMYAVSDDANIRNVPPTTCLIIRVNIYHSDGIFKEKKQKENKEYTSSL